ncbi:ATP19 family protein [Phanerochaete sordida]|uniref:ATP19 family protein n=1 Tax=Phanerochaete sordida TaxID=48140 RepID=A0A9P3L8T8_9APHY|nr:ATP19 family protein [Phanerochaete sordida]
MSYIIAGRAVKNEYLALGTLGLTGLIVSMAMSGGKKETAAPAGVKQTLAQVKDTVKIGAGSSEEEQLMDSIKNFIAEAEKESKH